MLQNWTRISGYQEICKRTQATTTTAKKLFIDNPNQATFIKYSNIILWTSMFGKLIMALLLKPFETFIEEYLLKRAIQQQKKLETA